MIIKIALQKLIIVISTLILVFIVPQTSTRENIIFKLFSSNSYFSNYYQIEFILTLINWVFILLFFSCTFFFSVL